MTAGLSGDPYKEYQTSKVKSDHTFESICAFAIVVSLVLCFMIVIL